MDEYRQNEKPLRETGKTLVGVLYSITSHGVEKRCEEKIRVEKRRKKEEKGGDISDDRAVCNFRVS
jgi:hypothetical protein